MASHIFKQETGLYLMFCEQVINESAEEFGMTTKQLRTYIWLYYFNKFVAKRPFINIRKSIEFFKQVDKSLITSSNSISALLVKMNELGYLDKVGRQYSLMTEESRGFVKKLSHLLSGKFVDFEVFSKDPSVRYHKHNVTARKRGRRKRRAKKSYYKPTGRPEGRPPAGSIRYTKTKNPWLKREAEAKRLEGLGYNSETIV